MFKSLPAHPTDEELRALSLGRLEESELARVCSHLVDCPNCCHRIDLLAAADPLLERLQHSAAHPDEELVSPAHLRSAVRALRLGQTAPYTLRSDNRVTESAMHAVPGQIADYDILAEVGRGGMGVVYKARHRSLNRLVALKMVLAGEFASPAQEQRFRLEAELAARVQHPNIVQIYEIGSYQCRPFLALEWVEGGSLADRLDGQPWPPGEAASFLATLAHAIHMAHSEGVMHRDLKPANILLQTGGGGRKTDQGGPSRSGFTADPASGLLPKITDFGLARPIEGGVSLTQSGLLVGTPGYMAPEQAGGSGRRALVGPAADIYALGVILYQLLTGQLPFQADSTLEVLRAVTSDEPVRPSRLQPRLPRDLEAITLHCLEKEPSRRYPSALALAEDLERFREGKQVAARPVGAGARLARACRRRPMVALLLGLLTASLFGGLAGVTWMWRKAESNLREADRQRVEANQHRVAAEAAQSRARDEASRAYSAEQEMRRQWYAASSNLMQAAWDTGQVGRLRALLAETEAYPDRGFEWYYWQRLCHLDQHTLIGHRSEVSSVSWSTDGARLATGSADGTAKVWDAAGGRVLLTLKGHTGPVRSVSWSADGARLATGSADGTAKVWDAAGGQVLLTLKGHTYQITSVSWSADGARLATGSADGTAKVWDAAGGRELLTLKRHTGPVRSVSWSADGVRLATGSADGTAKVWDAADGRELLTLNGHTNSVVSVSWSADGARLATGSSDGTAKVWDAAGGRELFTLKGHPGMVRSVSWSPDGARLATGSSDGTAKVWDAAGGRELHTLRGHTHWLHSVSWSADGARLATGSVDGTAKVWDAAGGGEMRTLKGHTDPIRSVSWSADGARLATGSADGTAKVWDAAGGQVRLTLKGHTNQITSVSWSADGARLATGSEDDTAKVWDAAGGRVLLTLKGHTGGVWSVSWSPDGARLATGSEDGTAKVWDAAGGRVLLTLKGHTNSVASVSWSPDGARLATGSEDGTAKVWDAAGTAAVQQWACQDRAVQDLLVSNDFRGPQAQGFLQTWLLLAPLPFDSGETGAQALDRPQLHDEASLRPRPGERVTIGGRPWRWQEHRSPKAVVDFNAVLGRVEERSVAYAVCYIESDRARDDLWLQFGTDEQAKVYLNGREIYQVRLSHALETLDTIGPARLKGGINVLLFKVVNETGQWEGCARLVDDAGRPVQGLRVKLTP
jgi:WD40 repeat protein